MQMTSQQATTTPWLPHRPKELDLVRELNWRAIEVGRRPLLVYDELTGTRPFTTHRTTEESS
ncbi:hypothetical protein E6R60_10850 [Streptomyces sp. A0642]|nr:hypothetical protein E6R60_10850 [Streptomyces sp. A0642]